MQSSQQSSLVLPRTLSGRSSWRAHAQLIRLPNVFTAMADIGLGALVTGSLPQQTTTFMLVLLASTCLYCAGMVWNDYFDVEQDRRERPFRPLPSGRVTMRQALILGTVLMVAGVIFAPMAKTYAFAIGGAILLAVTLAPVLASKLLASSVDRHPHGHEGRVMTRLRRVYGPVFAFGTAHPWYALALAMLPMVVAVVVLSSLGGEFMPALEEGNLLRQYDLGLAPVESVAEQLAQPGDHASHSARIPLDQR